MLATLRDGAGGSRLQVAVTLGDGAGRKRSKVQWRLEQASGAKSSGTEGVTGAEAVAGTVALTFAGRLVGCAKMSARWRRAEVVLSLRGARGAAGDGF